MTNTQPAAETSAATSDGWDPDVLDELEWESAVLVRNFELLRRRSDSYTTLDRAEYLLLRTAADLGSADINTLACAVGVGPSTAGRQLGAMAEAGLVRRDPDPADRRRCVIAPTADGRARLAEVRAQRARNLAELLAGFSPAEAGTLAEMFAKYNKAITDRYITSTMDPR
jgi:DNA-binding MarR family transcriptional regulator